MRSQLETHHVVPIALLGEDIKENKTGIMTQPHKNLHREQDVSARVVRRFRESTNGILVLDDHYFDKKERLWKRYFANVGNNPHKIIELQAKSLVKQANRYRRMNQYEQIRPQIYPSHAFVEGMVEDLIDQQKKRVRILTS